MMMLLYKEFRLTVHPTSIVFAFLGCLVLVPAYPYCVIFLFGCLAPYITFVNARETNDAWYTALLPVTKRENVLGKCLLTVSFQIFQMLFSIPFVVLRNGLRIANNPVGLDATPAWYGFGLLIYGIFDLIFLSSFYKSGYRAGNAFLFASAPLVLMMIAVETIAHIPALAWMDSYQQEALYAVADPAGGRSCLCRAFMSGLSHFRQTLCKYRPVNGRVYHKEEKHERNTD